MSDDPPPKGYNGEEPDEEELEEIRKQLEDL